MKHVSIRIFTLLLALALLCSAAPLPARAADDPVAVTGVTLDKSTLILEAGDDATLTATVAPDDANDKTVAWTSSDESVATVSDAGKVTAVAAGSATITVKTTDGDHTATCAVTVLAPVTDVTLSETLDIPIGKTGTLVAEFSYPPETDESNMIATVNEWTSDNTDVVTVAASGNTATLTARGFGSAKITAKYGDHTATCAVTVSGIKLSAGSRDMIVGETLALPTVTAYGAARDKSLIWSSKTPSIASVDSAAGTVKGNSDGTVEITCTVVGTTYTDTFMVTVSSNAFRTTMTRPALSLGDDTLVISKLKEVCRRVTGGNLNYLTGLSVDTAQGTLYYNYIAEADTGSGVSGTKKYYYSGSDESSLLKNISFVPKADFSGDATINYTLYATDGSPVTSQIIVTVPKSGAGGEAGIFYSSLENAPVRFQASDFAEYSEAVNGRGIRYVTFSLPSSQYGTLQYNRIDDDLYEGAVTANTRYYQIASPSLDDVYFVPRSGYTGTVNISFSGVDTGGKSLSGEVRVTVDGENRTGTAEVGYSVPVGTRQYLDAADFNDVCREVTGGTLSYIYFTSLNTTRGRIYYNSSTSVTTGTRYYRSGGNTIGNLSFLAGSSAGTVTFRYTGVDTENTSFTGTLRITVTTGGGGTIYYSTSAGETVNFNSSDFSAVSYDATGQQLNYITLASLPSSVRGTLYNLNQTASTGTSYYYAASGSRRVIDDLSFTAKNTFTSGSVSIPFTGRTTSGKTFTGSVMITVGSSGGATAVTDPNVSLMYYTTGPAVAFRSADFIAAAANNLDYPLSTVRFTQPAASVGRLCYDYSSPTNYTVLDASQEYAASAVSRIAFQPKAGFSGTAYVSFAATDTTGKTYTGTAMIQVTPPTSSAYFNDMGGYSWAVPSVDFLRGYGVVNGTASRAYTPAGKTRRCDYVLMLSRAFSFPAATGTGGFNDVSAGQYYASAVAAAKAAGVVSGESSEVFRPDEPVTRQDAAVLLYRTMKRSGSLPSGSYNDLSAFSDRDKVASYAVEALASLVRLGVIHGDGAGRLNPTATLSRAEMACLLHKALT